MSRHSQVELKNVLHVPEATVNLFSIRQAVSRGAQVTLRGNRCFVSLDYTVYMEGESQEDGLMVINQATHQPICYGSRTLLRVSITFKRLRRRSTTLLARNLAITDSLKTTPAAIRACFGSVQGLKSSMYGQPVVMTAKLLTWLLSTLPAW